MPKLFMTRLKISGNGKSESFGQLDLCLIQNGRGLMENHMSVISKEII